MTVSIKSKAVTAAVVTARVVSEAVVDSAAIGDTVEMAGVGVVEDAAATCRTAEDAELRSRREESHAGGSLVVFGMACGDQP